MPTLTETIASWVVPLFTIGVVLCVQCIFWIPTLSSKSNVTATPNEPLEKNNRNDGALLSMPSTASTGMNEKEGDDNDKDLFQRNDQWRCACEGGFLPPGLLKSFGSAEAMMRLGTGQCYHKQM